MNCLNSLRERERKLTTRFLVFGGAFAGAFFLTPVEREKERERERENRGEDGLSALSKFEKERESRNSTNHRKHRWHRKLVYD